MQLRGVCACRADRWVVELAARRRRPWVPWPADSEVVHAAAVSEIEDLTRDARLRKRLAAEVERWAAARWNEMGPVISAAGWGG